MTSAPALILTYHRVAEGPDPLLQCVSPTDFAAQIRVLPGIADVVRLAQLDDPSPRRRVAITFDDGYADNAQVAAPILRDAGVPATFFAPSRIVDDDTEHWWDRLEHLLMDGDDLPTEFVEWNGVRIDVRSAAGRARALKALNRRLRTRTWPHIDAALTQFSQQLGRATDGLCARHALMDAASITALAADDLFEIGSHAATHTMLSALGSVDLASEVAGSRQRLSELTQHPVTSLAYPYGTPESYTTDTVEFAKRAGYARACANVAGALRRRTNRFALPRCMVYDWSADEFAANLRAWFATF